MTRVWVPDHAPAEDAIEFGADIRQAEISEPGNMIDFILSGLEADAVKVTAGVGPETLRWSTVLLDKL